MGVVANPESSSGMVLVAFIGTCKCQKLEIGTTVDWGRKLFIKEAGPLFGVGTENCLKAELSLDSDFRGIMDKLALLPHITFFARCCPLESSQKMSLLLHCESNACSNVAKRKIAINISSIISMFI